MARLCNCISVPLRVLFCIVNNTYAIPVYLLWYFLFQPLSKLKPKMFWQLEGIFYEKLLSMVACWAQLSGHTLYASGDDISAILKDKCIVIANHQTAGDVAVLMHAFRGIRGALCHVMWIMDWIFQFLCFGWVAKGHGDFFLLQPSDIRKFSSFFRGTEDQIKVNEMKRFKEHLVNVFCKRDRRWMILFPEGGFLHKRRPGSQRFAKRNNLPVLTNVTLPRTGAFQAIIDVVGVAKIAATDGSTGDNSETVHYGSIKWIIDVTIGYESAEPVGMLSWVAGHKGSKKISLYYRVFNASDMLLRDTGDKQVISDKWLYDRFIEKEKLLEKFYQTGNFPPGKLGPKPVHCHTFQTVIGHTFCLCVWLLIAFIVLF